MAEKEKLNIVSVVDMVRIEEWSQPSPQADYGYNAILYSDGTIRVRLLNDRFLTLEEWENQPGKDLVMSEEMLENRRELYKALAEYWKDTFTKMHLK